MFGIGMTEMIIIAVVALIFIGPDQIPEVARTLGRLINDVKRSTEDIKRDLQQQTGLPKNFDEWLETRKNDPENQIAAPTADTELAQGSNGYGHDNSGHTETTDYEHGLLEDHNQDANEALIGAHSPGTPEKSDDEQLVMNLDTDDSTKDPNKS